MKARHGVRLCLLAGALALVGCAQPTPYQAAANGQGYAEQALEADRAMRATC